MILTVSKQLPPLVGKNCGEIPILRVTNYSIKRPEADDVEWKPARSNIMLGLAHPAVVEILRLDPDITIAGERALVAYHTGALYATTDGHLELYVPAACRAKVLEIVGRHNYRQCIEKAKTVYFSSHNVSNCGVIEEPRYTIADTIVEVQTTRRWVVYPTLSDLAANYLEDRSRSHRPRSRILVGLTKWLKNYPEESAKPWPVQTVVTDGSDFTVTFTAERPIDHVRREIAISVFKTCTYNYNASTNSVDIQTMYLNDLVNKKVRYAINSGITVNPSQLYKMVVPAMLDDHKIVPDGSKLVKMVTDLSLRNLPINSTGLMSLLPEEVPIYRYIASYYIDTHLRIIKQNRLDCLRDPAMKHWYTNKIWSELRDFACSIRTIAEIRTAAQSIGVNPDQLVTAMCSQRAHYIATNRTEFIKSDLPENCSTIGERKLLLECYRLSQPRRLDDVYIRRPYHKESLLHYLDEIASPYLQEAMMNPLPSTATLDDIFAAYDIGYYASEESDVVYGVEFANGEHCFTTIYREPWDGEPIRQYFKLTLKYRPKNVMLYIESHYGSKFQIVGNRFVTIKATAAPIDTTTPIPDLLGDEI